LFHDVSLYKYKYWRYGLSPPEEALTNQTPMNLLLNFSPGCATTSLKTLPRAEKAGLATP
jgi:hypothetical protein